MAGFLFLEYCFFNTINFSLIGHGAISFDSQWLVYDANSLKEVKRIPMKKPSGKYNIFNKIHRSSGTSHWSLAAREMIY